jgi:hypothetical protein
MTSNEAYAKYHAGRLARMTALADKIYAAEVADGSNASGPVRMGAIYSAIERTEGFQEREVWQAAWDSALANVKAEPHLGSPNSPK